MDALSYEETAESLNRDGTQCARLQHEARDGDHRRGWAAGGHGSLSQGPTHSNRPQQTPQGASRALREWILEEIASSMRMLATFCARCRYRAIFTQPGPLARLR